MRIRQVDFPAAVLKAQRSGELVVFAGAGVSMDAPSNYPDFNALASQVGGTQYPRHQGESIDHYLGRLEGLGVTVHDQVAKILSSPTSRPNATHQALVGIFGNIAHLRIVTTNFDRHFTAAAGIRFGAGTTEEYHAPALPVGSQFSGIVYLHGAVDKPSSRLVLTDSDFGRAYITQAWATKFLADLFSKFVVLFVGYSHQDLLLSYLARGLTSASPGPGRFSLTPPNDDARWKNLGIAPIHYPLSTPPDSPHSQLGIALTAWAEQSQAGALAVEERIRSIVIAGVPLTPEDDDFLRDALSDLSTLRFFTRHAHGVQWLQWVEAQPLFEGLFGSRSKYSDQDSELVSWFADHFVIQHPDAALDVVRRKGISALVWNAIALVLFRGKPHGAILTKWVALLVAREHIRPSNDVLDYILSHCIYPHDELSALLLIDFLTRPELHLKESLKWSADDTPPETRVEVELECSGSEYWLQQSWSTLFAPNLAAFAKRLYPIVTFHLSTARRLLVSFDEASAEWDSLSLSRGMIESRQQDHLGSGFSVLIDAGAAVMEWASEHDVQWAKSIITAWFDSESPLLRRLAIYGTAISTLISADEKLKWIIRNGLLYKFSLKHEVFNVLQRAYPQASVEARGELLQEVVKQHKPALEDPETADYELYNVVVWLNKSDPSCKLASQFLAQLKERNPSFGEREHPDMDSWIGPVSQGSWGSPVYAVDLTSYDIQQVLEELEAASDSEHPGTRSKRSLLRAIGEHAQSSHEWGLKIARQAQERSIWSVQPWGVLIDAWGATDLTENEWTTVINILESSVAVHEPAVQSIASLLERGIQSTAAPIPVALIQRAKNIADSLWVYCEDLEVEVISGEIDWLAKAINHPAGQVVEFYLRALSRLQRSNALSQDVLQSYEEVFSKTLDAVSLAAQLSRVVLASQLHFLFHLDQDWTVQNIFPLLDPQTNEQRARQCWHGYLYWGRWTDPMLVTLMRSYENMFPLIDQENSELRRAFCSHLSGIAIYSTIQPMEHGWLLRFLAIVKLETRVIWAGELRSVIQGLEGDAKVHLWRRWLKSYWQERLQGRPHPLVGKETAAMFEWATHLDSAFPDAVELIQQSPYPEFGHSMVYWQLSHSELLKQYPAAFVDLLSFLAGGEAGRLIYDLDELHGAVEHLVGIVPQNPKLKTLCDQLARLGVAGAGALAARLKPQ